MRARLSLGVLAAALTVGTIVDRAVPAIARTMGGYQVLAADFHVHVFPFGWSPLSVRETLMEATQQGLDVVAITPFVQTWQAGLRQGVAPPLSPPPLVVEGG